ncbi:MAG: Gfo/Idh/MocA family oxidoreductase [Phycisphaerae bacterium]|nr:Gfo/Idh/MocA family oxidoreductase [Phycisphaerae bacterium]
MAAKVKVGVIGCGNISDAYFTHCAKHEILDMVACADLDLARAKAKAAQHGLPRACTVAELLAADLDVVLNLTVPRAHAGVSLAALAAGKHVYSEKPLAVSREDGRKILEAAGSRGLRVGCAPDTFLGAGLQTCRKLLDDGAIGRPVAASAFMMCPGHESWHPDPAFYYQPGGGPMFDMGPYYLTALVALLGPIDSICGQTGKAHDLRTVTSKPLCGTKIPVEVPTHVAGLMRFARGALGTLVTSFDVQAHAMPCLEIYGTEGSMAVPDPNTFGGPVRVWERGASAWREVSLTHGYAAPSRGVGLADLAWSLRDGRAHRASGELAFHVLDAMHAFHEASDRRQSVASTAPCDRPAPLPPGLAEGVTIP